MNANKRYQNFLREVTIQTLEFIEDREREDLINIKLVLEVHDIDFAENDWRFFLEDLEIANTDTWFDFNNDLVEKGYFVKKDHAYSFDFLEMPWYCTYKGFRLLDSVLRHYKKYKKLVDEFVKEDEPN